MFRFRTDTLRTIQAAAVLLRQEKNRMDRIRLLKLLYIADREALREMGKPIVGGRVVAMDNGPLHSEIYDLIKAQHEREARWSEFFANEGHVVTLKKDPGRIDLSAYEIEKLTEVSDRYSSMDSWAVAHETHKFEEYGRCYEPGTSRTIPLEEILASLEFTQEEIDELREDAAAHGRLVSAFHG